MNRKDLITNQYKCYSPNALFPAAKAHYQKVLDDKFFININEYDSEDRVRYSGFVHFDIDDDTAINIELLHVKSVEHAETFFANAFEVLKAQVDNSLILKS